MTIFLCCLKVFNKIKDAIDINILINIESMSHIIINAF